MSTLRKIDVVDLGGEKLDIAAGSDNHFHLVKETDPDVYGNPHVELVPSAALAATPARIQGLIDLVGRLTVRVQGQKDLRQAAEGGEV